MQKYAMPHDYASNLKISKKYAKNKQVYANVIFICKICTPFFADAGVQRSRELLVQERASIQAEQGGGGGCVLGLHSLNVESHLEKRHPAISRLIPGYPGITRTVTYPGISQYKSG